VKTPSNNIIALIFGLLSVAVALIIFAWSRQDPGLRMAALVSASNIAASVLAISSTLLTGKDLTQKEPPDNTTSVVAPPTTTVTVEPPKE
jgi:hypothetical protein